MAINGKRKGKVGELELAHKLQDYGYKTYRSVQYNGKDGQADVVGLPHIHVECKRQEKLNIYDAMDQAKRDAKHGDKPTVFHRKNNRKWLVTMELDSFMELYQGYINSEKVKAYIEQHMEGNDG